VTETKHMMAENGKDGAWLPSSALEYAEPTRLKSEAQLSCVSLRSELDDEVTCGAVKGQDERRFGATLTAPQVTTGSIQRGTELA
jgi:hypothetical protein